MELIDGVFLKDLKVLTDERGGLFEILRNDDELFQKYPFGQVYGWCPRNDFEEGIEKTIKWYKEERCSE